MEAPAADSIEAEFARRLAGNEKRGRDRALKKLKQFINLRSARTDGGFTRTEMLSIWKGLFYCMWMSDKPLVQEELANKISDLMIGLPSSKTVMLIFDVFLETMQREWKGIDRLRMDKFYLLVRRMIERGLKFLQSQNWDVGVVDWMLAILKSGPICPTNPVMGMHYHLCDIYLEEIAKIGKGDLPSEVVLKLLDPYCIMVTKAKNADLVRSTTDEVFQQLIENSLPALDLLAEEEEGLVDIRSHTQMQDYDSSPITALNVDYKALAGRLYELASEDCTISRNRKNAFRLVEKFRELAEGRLPLADIPDAEYSSEDEVEVLEEHLTSAIVSESTKEVQDLQEDKKARRRLRRKEKIENMDGVDDVVPESDVQRIIDAESLVNGLAEEIDEESIEPRPKKKKMKVVVTPDPTAVESTIPKSNKENRKPNAITQDLTEATDILEKTDKKVNNEQAKEKPAKKKWSDNSETIILGSALQKRPTEKEISETKDEMDDTVMEFTPQPNGNSKKSKKKTMLKRRESRKIKSDSVLQQNTTENMPDILQDIAERGKQEKTDVDIKENTKNIKKDTQSVALFKQSLDMASESEESNVVVSMETAEESFTLNASVVKVKCKKKKKSRKSASNSISELKRDSFNSPLRDAGDMTENTLNPEEVTFEKFATICKAKGAQSTFVKFAAAKVTKNAQNKHLIAIKRKHEDPVAARSPKRVVFEMSKTQIQPFRKTDKATAVSPSPNNIAFDPRRTPRFGLLKRSNTPQKKRKSAADFF